MKNITPIIIILVAIALFSLLVQPAFDSARPLQAEVAQYQAAIEKADALNSLTQEKVTAYNNLPPASLNELLKIIPDSSDVTHVLADINTLALKYGSSISGVNVSSSNSDSSRSIASRVDIIGFTFSATYPKFILFMKDLERSLRIMDVDSISFKSTDKGIYDYKVTFKIYSAGTK